jgi:hypothetical protein
MASCASMTSCTSASPRCNAKSIRRAGEWLAFLRHLAADHALLPHRPVWQGRSPGAGAIETPVRLCVSLRPGLRLRAGWDATTRILPRASARLVPATSHRNHLQPRRRTGQRPVGASCRNWTSANIEDEDPTPPCGPGLGEDLRRWAVNGMDDPQVSTGVAYDIEAPASCFRVSPKKDRPKRIVSSMRFCNRSCRVGRAGR